MSTPSLSGGSGRARCRVCSVSEPRRRLRPCVEQWPECEDGAYNPSCCRFPKSCSCTVYSDTLPDTYLEPPSLAPATKPEPPDSPSPTIQRMSAELRAVVAERDALRAALRDVPVAYETKVTSALDHWLPPHAEGCDEGSTQQVCLRCDVMANIRVAYGFARPLRVLAGEAAPPPGKTDPGGGTAASESGESA